MKFFKKRGVALAVLVLSIAAAVCIGQSRKAGYIQAAGDAAGGEIPPVDLR